MVREHVDCKYKEKIIEAVRMTDVLIFSTKYKLHK
jgi:hypothetical protein